MRTIYSPVYTLRPYERGIQETLDRFGITYLYLNMIFRVGA